MRTIFLVSLCFLTACSNSITNIQSSTRQTQAECENKMLTGEYKRYVEVADCINSAIADAAITGNNKYVDLIELANAKRMELAQRVDQKKMSKEQADLELAQLNSSIASEERSRKLNLINTYSNYRAATAPAPVYTQPPRQGFTCHQMGAFTNCY